jgi:hypothetical protein
VDDVPVAAQELDGFVPPVFDADEIRKDEFSLKRVGLTVEIQGTDTDENTFGCRRVCIQHW